tara:strand:+ start:243 stop:515 length:273 start_codon:yes stop_codon:yes gene_type:complete
MDNINMSEEQYQALYNRIKTDLYNEFINPETATYGLDVVRQEEPNKISERQIIKEEIEGLKAIMKKYEEDEEYEKAAFIQKRIERLKNRL